jgi:hypothetical protein
MDATLLYDPDGSRPARRKRRKGNPGAPGSALRVVSPESSIASCEADEIMISAYCTGTFNAYPLVGRHGWPTLNPPKPHRTVLRVAERQSTR